MTVFINFEYKPLLFANPRRIICCYDPLKLNNCFEEIEEAKKQGFYLAGFISYEAGYSFEDKLYDVAIRKFPLIYMGVYEKPSKAFLSPKDKKDFHLSNLSINISREEYGKNIEKIHEYIAQGECYQITYCIKLHFDFSGEPQSLYSKLFDIQKVPYSAFIADSKFNILSLSPERFIRKTGKDLLSEPMKGTWFRGRNFLRDILERQIFSRDRKNRAENVMIADLLRNDLGRIGKRVRAPKLFTVTPYKTLYQMTSTVKAKTKDNVSMRELFKALFPSGSVTGAPKIRAMQIIRELEKEERKIYTGAIVYITPQNDFYFNVPIRTILLEGNKGEMGIGGGIVWDSTPEGEWQEGLLKAKFFTDLLKK